MNHKQHLATVAQAGSFVCAVISSFAMLGYTGRWEWLTTWLGDTRMAIPTAVCLFILSVCVWVCAHILRHCECQHYNNLA